MALGKCCMTCEYKIIATIRNATSTRWAKTKKKMNRKTKIDPNTYDEPKRYVPMVCVCVFVCSIDGVAYGSRVKWSIRANKKHTTRKCICVPSDFSYLPCETIRLKFSWRIFIFIAYWSFIRLWALCAKPICVNQSKLKQMQYKYCLLFVSASFFLFC